MNKLQTIIKKCIEANESIVELKFGCEVEYVDLVFSVYDLSFGEICIVHREGGRKEKVFESDIKIIGRPITLEDVLMAVDKTKRTGCLNVNQAGILEYESSRVTQRQEWHLGKTLEQNWELWSEQEREFIYELLK